MNGIIQQPNCFAGFQTWIGYVDVKSSPVYFFVQRNATVFDATRTPIPFDVERLNVGGAMNLTSGIFTAPRDGIYSFSFSGLVFFPPSSSSRVYLHIYMYLNGSNIARGAADEFGTSEQYETISFQSTFNLKAGDQIWIEIDRMYTGVYLDDNYFTHFSGHLLEENFAIV